MMKGLLVASAIMAGGLLSAAQAGTLQTGRSTYVHHHYHAAHHYHMVNGRHNAQRGLSYGTGSHPPRTTATGGNPGGYSTKN